MSGFVGPNNCTICIACFNNCSACPKHACQKRTMYLNNLDRVNKQVRMSSSLSLLKRRALNVSNQVGQSANPYYLSQAGGPGDLISSVQRTNKCSVSESERFNLRFQFWIVSNLYGLEFISFRFLFHRYSSLFSSSLAP